MKRATRRERGVAQNFANQLAQMAVGMEAMFLGSALKKEPLEGLIEIDVLSMRSLVNGHPISLALSGYLHKWVIGELARKSLDRSWLMVVRVKIRYSRKTDRVDNGAYFNATAVVRSGVGVMEGAFSNSQPLVGGFRRWLRAPF